MKRNDKNENRKRRKIQKTGPEWTLKASSLVTFSKWSYIFAFYDSTNQSGEHFIKLLVDWFIHFGFIYERQKQ